MSVVSLTEAKAFLNIESTDDDAELQSMLERAESILVKRVGSLAPLTVTDEVHSGPGPLVLKRYPVVSVSSATSGGVEVTDLDLDADAGVVYGTFSCLRRSVKVTYVTGRADLPEDLVAAVLELVHHLWGSQRVPGTSRGFQGFGGGAGDTEPPPGAGYLLPYRVQSLIEPYLVPVIA